MAHFAELDENNVVKRVIAVANDVNTADGPLGENDMHVDGEEYCKLFYKDKTTIWKQTSYNGNFRKQYAGVGYTYNPSEDIFIKPQPHDGWTLDENYDWQPPEDWNG
tara:strand:- start:2086 stop:2406 length:321 start_codon:yes stop_codon:yes gene_type:complete